ncbi:MAG: SDR family NAD(P)-dependent oxidoreductase, partial [Candidatus Acidiferrum sp.]
MTQKNTANPVDAASAPLAGQVALVTGGSRGIGRAIAFRLAQLGASVAICGRDSEALKAAEAGLKKIGSPVYSRIADVSRSTDVSVLVDATQAALGPIS